ncbi:MAG: flagellar basal body P-ring formation chaperone FlgA [Gemmatimonadota bacterium]
MTALLALALQDTTASGADSVVRALLAERLAVRPEAIVFGRAPVSPAGWQFCGLDEDRGLWTVRFCDGSGADTVLQTRVGVAKMVPVAARRLPRGTVLTESDISVARVVDWDSHRPSDPLEVKGWVTRRIIRQGERLREPALTPAPAVRAGDTVLLLAGGPGFRLSITGTATADARPGRAIAIRLGTGRVVTGTVVGPGTLALIDSTSKQ